MSIRNPVPVLCACGCGEWAKGASKSGYKTGHANRGRRFAPRAPGFPDGVLIDEQDRARFGEHSWSISSNGYVQRHAEKPGGGWTKVRLHREIMGFPDCEVDHINGNKLDHRRENLRAVPRAVNAQNTKQIKPTSSGIRGVSWRKKTNQWYAYAKIAGKMISLGFYDDLEDAARVSHEFRLKHYLGYVPR